MTDETGKEGSAQVVTLAFMLGSHSEPVIKQSFQYNLRQIVTVLSKGTLTKSYEKSRSNQNTKLK